MRAARLLRLARRVIARPLAVVRRLNKPFILASLLRLPRHEKQRRPGALMQPQHRSPPSCQHGSDGVRKAQGGVDAGLKRKRPNTFLCVAPGLFEWQDRAAGRCRGSSRRSRQHAGEQKQKWFCSWRTTKRPSRPSHSSTAAPLRRVPSQDAAPW